MGKATTRTKPVRRETAERSRAKNGKYRHCFRSRLIEVLHFCFRRHKTAEIRVPAWLVTNPENKVDDSPAPVDWVVVAPNADSGGNEIYQAHSGKTGHTQSRDETPPPPSRVFLSTILHIFSVTQLKLRLLRTRGASFHGAGSTFLRMAGAFESVRVEALMS